MFADLEQSPLTKITLHTLTKQSAKSAELAQKFALIQQSSAVNALVKMLAR
jgi:hypothetical protein